MVVRGVFVRGAMCCPHVSSGSAAHTFGLPSSRRYPCRAAATITRMIQKAPAARYQTYAELITDLRRAHDSLTAPAPVKSKLPPALLGAAALATLVAVAMLIGLTLPGLPVLAAGPVSASRSSAVAAPTSVVANGAATSTITVTLRDADPLVRAAALEALAPFSPDQRLSVAAPLLGDKIKKDQRNE